MSRKFIWQLQLVGCSHSLQPKKPHTCRNTGSFYPFLLQQPPKPASCNGVQQECKHQHSNGTAQEQQFAAHAYRNRGLPLAGAWG